MITRYVILDAEYMDDAITADRMTASMSSGSRYFSFDTSEFLVHIVGDTKLVIQVDEGTGALSFIPVANRVPVDAKTADATLDYRNGYGSVEDAKDATVPEGQRRPVESEPLVLHASFEGSEMSVVKNTILTGSSSWYGDTDNVISWNGIGAMDGCGNDYRTYRQMNTGRYYNTPGYEATYYHANDRNTPPDSGGHLMGDGHYITDVKDKEPSPKPKAQWNTALFVNGSLTKHALGPVLAACEVAYTTGDGEKKTKLRVLVGRWLPPEDKYTPVSGDPDFLFESMTLNGFYLYDEDEDSPSGWSLKIIDIPVLDAHPDYPNTSFLAQAPHFSADGSVAVGIAETGFGGGNESGAVYFEGKRVNKVQAWVFRINCDAGTCVWVEPASTYTTEYSGTSTYDSTSYSYTRSQTLAVYPTGVSTINKIVKKTVTTTTKSISDAAKAAAAATPITVYPEDAMVQVNRLHTLILSRLGEIQTVFREAYPTSPFSDGIGFAIYPTSNNHQSVDPNAYSYVPEPADVTTLAAFRVDNGEFVETWPGSPVSGMLTAWQGNQFGGSFIGICGKSTLNNPNQTVSTTKSVTIDVCGTEVTVSSGSQTSTSGGQEVVMRGDGWIASGYGCSMYGYYPSMPIELNRSWQTNTFASTTTGELVSQDLVLVAADPRKAAGIVKNMTSGALQYVGVNEPSGGF